MTPKTPRTGRLPAYGRDLLAARSENRIKDGQSHTVYLSLDGWLMKPQPELGKWVLALQADQNPADFDWRLVAGLVVVVLHKNVASARLAAVSNALMAAQPASLLLLDLINIECQTVFTAEAA